MGAGLEGVVERRQLLGRRSATVGESLGEEPVGEHRIAGEEGAVQVGADRAPEPAALEAGATVVAESGHHASERGGALVEQRPPGVVLEPGDRRPEARLELAFEQDVADHARLTGDRLVREERGARHPGAVAAAIAAAEQLVAATDCKQRDAGGDGFADGGAFRSEVGRNERLLAVLPAADVEEVVPARLEASRRGRSA